jgi:TolB protein
LPDGEPTQLQTGLSGDHHISWSPDGTQVAFDAYVPDGRPGTWIIPAEGGKPRAVEAAGIPSFQPSWSPCGDELAFGSFHSGNVDISILRLETGESRRITHHEAMDHHPSWSPDCKKIAFISGRDGDLDVWSVTVETEEVVQLTNLPGREEQACYSPDGSVIAFVRVDSDESALCALALEPGDLDTLVVGPGVSWPSWSPSGEKIAFAAQSAEGSDIWILTFDLSEDAEHTD